MRSQKKDGKKSSTSNKTEKNVLLATAIIKLISEIIQIIDKLIE